MPDTEATESSLSREPTEVCCCSVALLLEEGSVLEPAAEEAGAVLAVLDVPAEPEGAGERGPGKSILM